MGNENPLNVRQLCQNDVCRSGQMQIVPLNETEQIRQRLLQYSRQNNLGLYSIRQRRMLETLVSLNQEHVSDCIIELSKAQNFQAKAQLYEQLEPINLEDFDGLIHNLKQQQQQSPKITKNRNFEKQVKIITKRQLRSETTFNSLGAEILQNNEVIILAPVQCFSGKGVLSTETGLPSGVSLIKHFINKVKEVNRRRSCSLGLIFLVNEEYIEAFEHEMQSHSAVDQSAMFCNEEVNSELSNIGSGGQEKLLSKDRFYYHTVKYRSPWPMVDQNFKIILDQSQERIQFGSQSGDIINFMENSSQISTLISRYNYVHVTNLNNMLSQIGDAVSLGFLESEAETDILVKALQPQGKQVQLSSCLSLSERGFIQFASRPKPQKISDQMYTPNNPFFNIEEYFLKTRLLNNQSAPLKRLLFSRIKTQLCSGEVPTLQSEHKQIPKPSQFFLKRQISDILFGKLTCLLMVEEHSEFSHSKSQQIKSCNKNAEIGYSNYCKKIIGFKGTKQHELVDIDSGILHKGSKQILKLVKKVSSIEEVGFPLVIYSDFCC